jgi:hypothetical protein
VDRSTISWSNCECDWFVSKPSRRIVASLVTILIMVVLLKSGSDGRSALHWGSILNRRDIVRALLEADALVDIRGLRSSQLLLASH